MAKIVKVGKDDIPALDLVKGMHTRYNVCQETAGTELLRMGVCHHDADMADLKWDGKVEEAFYVAKGSIKVLWEGESGERGEAVIHEGEQIFLPKGYHYTLRSTGEPAINVFAIAGGPTNLGTVIGQEASQTVKSAAARLGPR